MDDRLIWCVSMNWWGYKFKSKTHIRPSDRHGYYMHWDLYASVTPGSRYSTTNYCTLNKKKIDG